MKLTKQDLVDQRDYSLCFNIDNQKLWFQKKKVLISPDGINFEITDVNIDEAKKSLEEFKKNNDKKITVITNKPVEDYNENVFRVFINLELQNEEKREFEKSCFVSKKYLTADNIKDNEITLPLWFWNKIEEDIIKDSVAYSNEKFDTDLTSRDYKILNKTEIN